MIPGPGLRTARLFVGRSHLHPQAGLPDFGFRRRSPISRERVSTALALRPPASGLANHGIHAIARASGDTDYDAEHRTYRYVDYALTSSR
jgi:hypothetical protein